MLSSPTRYLRMARLLFRLPTYARVVWGLARDPRTPIGLKALLGAALAYVVMPGRPDPRRHPDHRPCRRPHRPAAGAGPVHPERAGRGPRPSTLARARNGTADLDQDLARLRALLGDRFDRIRDNLPELLERYGALRDPTR